MINVLRNHKGLWLRKKCCSKIEKLLEKRAASCGRALSIVCDLRNVQIADVNIAFIDDFIYLSGHFD